MRKINSIGYGGKILGIAMIFALVIPGSMHLVMLVYENALLAICAKISLGIGIVITFSFCVLLLIEFHQDKEKNLYYETQKKVKLSLGNGMYECQSCGNKTVLAKDKNCGICGILFEDKGNKMKKPNELSALAQTLFIPLAVRAKEAECSRPIFVDKMAIDIFNQCDTHNMIIDGGEISTHGILARTQVIDTEVERLLSANPNAIVINLGAGLDTRFFRLDNGAVIWYDLDLPEVIALRKQFITENNRLHFIAKSVMDYSWIDEIKYSSNDTVILIAEGLLMYFTEKDVKEFMNVLTSQIIHLKLERRG